MIPWLENASLFLDALAPLKTMFKIHSLIDVFKRTFRTSFTGNLSELVPLESKVRVEPASMTPSNSQK